MDIHPPKHIDSWRAFFVEVAIIVLGVLIALAGEQIVEGLHWQSKVSEAESAMRSELFDDDGEQAYDRWVIVGCIDKQLAALAKALADQRDLGGVLPSVPVTWPPLRSWDDDAWRSAISSEVTNHISSNRMDQLSGAYDMIPTLAHEGTKEVEDAADLRTLAYAKTPLARAERDRLFLSIERLRRDNAVLADGALFFLQYLKDAGLDLAPAAMRDIQTIERRRWGACVQTPSVAWIIDQTPLTSR